MYICYYNVYFFFQVYLDIKFARDPQIKLPLVIFPAYVTQEDKDVANTEMGIGSKSWISKQTWLTLTYKFLLSTVTKMSTF